MADNSNNGSTTRGQREYTSQRDGSVSPKAPPPEPEFPPEEDRTSTTTGNIALNTNYQNQPAYNHFTVPRTYYQNTTSSHPSYVPQSNSAITRAQAQTTTAVSPLRYSDGTRANNRGAQAVQYQTAQTSPRSYRGTDAEGRTYTAKWENKNNKWSYEYD